MRGMYLVVSGSMFKETDEAEVVFSAVVEKETEAEVDMEGDGEPSEPSST